MRIFLQLSPASHPTLSRWSNAFTLATTLALFLACANAVLAQTTPVPTVVTSITGENPGGSVVVRAQITDAAGNLYQAGSFTADRARFGGVGGSGSAFTLQRSGTSDSFIAKQNAAGQVQWVRGFGSSGANTFLGAIALDASGSIVAGGSLAGANSTAPALTRIGNRDGIVMKLDSNGNVTWAKNFGGAGANVGVGDIAVRANGQILLAGEFNSADLTTPALTRLGTADGFLMILDASGSIQSTQSFGGAGSNASASRVALDGAGNIFLSGNFNGAGLTTPALALLGTQTGYVVKLNGAGVIQWAQAFGGAGLTSTIYGMRADASGNVVAALAVNIGVGTGLTSPATIPLTGFTAGAVVKLDASGAVAWSNTLQGIGAIAQPFALALDASGNPHVTGNFGFASLTTPALTLAGGFDGFAVKVNAANGSVIWSRALATATGAVVTSSAIAVDTSGRVQLGGSFTGASMVTPALALRGITDALTVTLDASGADVRAQGYDGYSPASAAGNTGVAVDGAGNSYQTVALAFNRIVAGNISLTRVGAGDAAVVKRDSTGAVVWAKGFGGPGASVGITGIAADAAGNSFVAGNLSGGSLTTPALALVGTRDAFVTKLDPSGNVLWVRSFNGPSGRVFANAIAVDASGNSYITGQLASATLTSPALTRFSTSGADAIAVKLDSAGNIVWSRNVGGAAASLSATSIAVDSTGNVTLGGYFDGSNMTTPAITGLGLRDAYVIRLASNGAVTWGKSFGGAGAQTYAFGVATDTAGNAYFGGWFASANITAPAATLVGIVDALAVKLDSAGNTVWSKTFAGAGSNASIDAVTTNSAGEVFVTGTFGSGNIANLTPTLTRIGTRDAFAAKLDSSGTVRFAANYGGAGVTVQAGAMRSALGTGDSLQITGNWSGGALTSPALANSGSADAFQFRLPGVPTPVVVVVPPPPPPPSAPTNVSCSVTGGAINCGFGASTTSGSGTVTGYTVYCRDVRGDVTVSQSITSTSFSIPNLLRDRSYTCYISAFGNGGIGPAATLQLAPRATPLANQPLFDIDGYGFSQVILRGGAGGSSNPNSPDKIGGLKTLVGRFDGARFTFSDTPDLGPGWDLLGAGDFTGSGMSALLSRNTHDQVRVDLSLPGGVTSIPDTNGVIIRSARSDWVVEAIGDLDGDGKADILWRYMKPGSNDAGVTFAWFMDGNIATNTVNVSEVKTRGGAPLSWAVIGIADLNNDKLGDIVWQSPTGQLRALMGQAGRTWNNQLIGQLPAGYSVVKLGDFDGDGRADILLGDSQGRLKLWTMSGSTITNDLTLTSINPAWKFFAAGDFDGNGTMDIVWVKPDGTLVVWLAGRSNEGNQGAFTVIDNAGTAPTGYASLEP